MSTHYQLRPCLVPKPASMFCYTDKLAIAASAQVAPFSYAQDNRTILTGNKVREALVIARCSPDIVRFPGVSA